MENLTILAVAYKPKKELVDRLIENFISNYPILFINNSLTKLDQNFYNKKNLTIIDNSSNLGNGAGINLGLKEIKTKYALYLDFDSFIDNYNFEKLISYQRKLKNFAVLIPNSSKKDVYQKPYKTWEKEGSIMLFNLEQIKKKISFDENFFLYFEECDFFYNCLKKKMNVLFLPKVYISHEQGTSSDEISEDTELKELRMWHYMWSQFYFYKKNFGYFYALSKCVPFFIKDIFMIFLYLIRFDFSSLKIRYIRISGFANSLFGLKSWKRIK